jgi:hypothetical protein
MYIAMHVADKMSNPRGLGDVTGRDDEDVLVGSADDICGFGIVVQELTRMKNGARRQFEREDDAIGSFDETSHAAPIDGVHRQLHDRQSGRRLCVWMEHAHGNRSR